VGALGLDLPGVHLVIQLDAPRTWKTYAHRAGRAGRMGAPGESVTVINEVQLRVLAREAARLGLKLGGAPQPTGQRPSAQPERPNKYERKRAVVSGQQQRSSASERGPIVGEPRPSARRRLLFGPEGGAER
jgi:superfamily II DNA/RNA helicase